MFIERHYAFANGTINRITAVYIVVDNRLSETSTMQRQKITEDTKRRIIQEHENDGDYLQVARVLG